jgi:hypothetical protein
MARTGANALAGSWTYRSLHNNPTFRLEKCKECDDLRTLIFAEAELVIDDFAAGDFSGRLILELGVEMTLKGTSNSGTPPPCGFWGVARVRASRTSSGRLL